MCFCCGQLLVKYENEVKLVALSVKLGSIVNLCDVRKRQTIDDGDNCFLKGSREAAATKGCSLDTCDILGSPGKP